MIRDYKDLEVWQKSIELVKDIYKFTKKFPRHEFLGLTSSMRRSAMSISSNIAGAWMRQHTSEYTHFIYHTLGACGELDTQIMISERLGYLKRITAMELSEKVDHINRLLRNLIKGLKR